MPHTPLSRYQQLVEQCEITSDAGQRAVIDALEERYMMLTQQQPTSLLEKLFGRINEKERMRGLYLWGGVGRGKSMLMDIFFHSLEMENKRRIHFHQFMLEIHAAMHQQRHAGVEDPLLHVVSDLCKRYKVLCFDELQVKDIADAMILSRLFFEILDREVMVIFTSNRRPQDLYLHGLQRERFLPFIALIEQQMDVMEIASDNDYRQMRQLALQKRYVAPHSPELRRAFYQQFIQLNHHEMPKPQEVQVQGRVVRVPLACRDAAWFHFRDLCDVPLGAADYLELVQLYRYFFIEDVPLLGAEQRNAALRFITLIDILYEAKATVCITAAAMPEYLHRAGDGSFEFARTASRLREMMSEAYGK
jgi:cell division protein ZapE